MAQTVDQMERLVSDVEQAIDGGDMSAIEQIVLAHRGTPYEQLLLASPRIMGMIPRIQAAYCDYETADERTLRARLMRESAGDIAGSAPIERTYAYVPLEAAAARMHNGARYCHVGSGPLPETLLAMRAVAPHAGLMGIDADATALAMGREFTQAIMPNSAIDFLHAAGDEVDYGGFTHIHVAVLVRPEYDVIRRICETAHPAATLMLRTVEGLGSMLYEPLSLETEVMLAARGYTRIATVRGHAIMNTAIYRR